MPQPDGETNMRHKVWGEILSLKSILVEKAPIGGFIFCLDRGERIKPGIPVDRPGGSSAGLLWMVSF